MLPELHMSVRDADGTHLGSAIGIGGLQEERQVEGVLHFLDLDPHSALGRVEANTSWLVSLQGKESLKLIRELPDRQDGLLHRTNEEGHDELDVRPIFGSQLELHGSGHAGMLDLNSLGIPQPGSLVERMGRDPGRKGLWAHMLIGPRVQKSESLPHRCHATDTSRRDSELRFRGCRHISVGQDCHTAASTRAGSVGRSAPGPGASQGSLDMCGLLFVLVPLEALVSAMACLATDLQFGLVLFSSFATFCGHRPACPWTFLCRPCL